MTNLNQWANYTKEINYRWREPYFVDSENYDLALDYCEILDNDKDFKIKVLEKEEL